jgi:hypothetical protein
MSHVSHGSWRPLLVTVFKISNQRLTFFLVGHLKLIVFSLPSFLFSLDYHL